MLGKGAKFDMNTLMAVERLSVRAGVSMPPLSPGVSLLDCEPGSFAVFAYSNFTIVVWPAPATVGAVTRLSRATDRVVSAYPGGYSNVHLIPDRGTGIPSPEARAGLVRMAERLAGKLACVGVVLLGSGFWASALQSVITGMRLVSARTYAMRIDRSVEGLARWMPDEHLRRTGVSVSAAEFRAALEQALHETSLHEPGASGPSSGPRMPGELA
jgi:hypothetical protein